MKILIADALHPLAVNELESAGFRVTLEPKLKDSALVAALIATQPEVLIVRSTKVTEAMCSATDTLELIIRAGAGVNSIDLEAAARQAICVSNCPGMNATAVAELTFALILNDDRKLSKFAIANRQKSWQKKALGNARGLMGGRLGLLGFGAIAQQVAKRAFAFGMSVHVFSRSRPESKDFGHQIHWYSDAESVAKNSDWLSVHLPLTEQTRGFVDGKIIGAMPEGSLLVNTSRAEIVDHAAMLNAVMKKRIRAAVDVLPDEPKTDGHFDHELLTVDDVTITHHIGASTTQAQIAIALKAAEIARHYAATGVALHCVNLASKTKASHLLVIRHHDRIGVLAQVLDTLSQAEINVQSMSNEIFHGDGSAACAKIQVSNPLSVEDAARLKSLPDIISVAMVGLP